MKKSLKNVGLFCNNENKYKNITDGSVSNKTLGVYDS